MSTGIKTLMVDAGLDDTAEARVRLAAALAGRFGARVVGLGACAARPPVTGPFGETAAVSMIIEGEVERVHAILQSAADRFGVATKNAGVPAEWRSFPSIPARRWRGNVEPPICSCLVGAERPTGTKPPIRATC